MSIEKEIRIRTKTNVFVIMASVTAILLTISILCFYWWAGLLLATLINYFLFRECYPSVSALRAEKIMRSSRVYHLKDEKIPCPIYVIRIMADRNLDLHYQNKAYRWFLTTSSDFFSKEKDLKVRKIKGMECFFFTQKCFSDTYIEQEEKTRQMKKAMAEAEKKLKRI